MEYKTGIQILHLESNEKFEKGDYIVINEKEYTVVSITRRFDIIANTNVIGLYVTH
jgi:uncharacterized Zn finger protein